MITVYKNNTDKINPKYVSVDYVLERIKQGAVQKQIDELRKAITDGVVDAELKKMKGRLPCVLFSGKFEKREDSGLVEHSGFVILDWDKLTDPADKVLELTYQKFIYAAFISPSGNGVKALARIPKEISKHRGYYRGLMKMFPELDSTSQNESRICYMSSDPNIYINTNAVEFTDYCEEQKTVTNNPVHIPANGTNYRKIAIAVDMIRNAPDGQKHIILLKASKLMGGYIATGAVDENEAVRVLETEIGNRDISDFGAAQTTIQKGIEYGKGKPLFELEAELSILPTNVGIKPIDDVWEAMKYTFRHGKKRGETTHFDKFDENFKWKAGEITLIIARPNAGKTEFTLQLMLMKSVFSGWKWGVFSPENYPQDEFYDSLIHAYIGKTTDPYYGDHQMSIEDYEKGYKFVREHFFYVYPDRHTMEEIESNFMYLIKDKKINGTFIDPHNQIEADYGARQDLFLSKHLTDRKRFAIKYGLHDVISAHPKSMSRNRNGEYEIPDMYDISGGAMWGNKMDNIIVLHRPNFLTNPMDTTVEVHVRKVKKQRLVGIPGVCTFNYVRKTNRYYIDDLNPLDGYEKPKLTPLKNFYEVDKKEATPF